MYSMVKQIWAFVQKQKDIIAEATKQKDKDLYNKIQLLTSNDNEINILEIHMEQGIGSTKACEQLLEKYSLKKEYPCKQYQKRGG